MVEILHNNYQIPVYSVEDQDNIINLIHSKEFNDIYSFYSEQIPRGSRLEQLPDFEKRMGFYLYYTGQEQFLNQLDVLLYKKHMPTIQEFLKDDAYMGNSYAIIYPYWRQILAKIFDPSNQYFECVFRGSIGSGKSTIARRGLIYALYRICCLRSPHKLFNIAPDTVLSALMISVTLQQAQDTALKPVLEMIRNSPCFHEVRKMTAFDSFGPNDPVPFCRQGNGIRFPNNVYLSVGSNINHIIGYSVFGCLTGDTEVVTDSGNIRIEDIAKSCNQYKVKTRELDGTFTWNNINHCECTKEVNELVEIELENGQSIRCTPDHKFPVEMVDSISKKNLIFYCGQWCKKAKDLKIFDNLVGCKIKNVRLNLLKQPVKVYNLEVNNDLHNYLLSSGVVTCNSIFDEAEEKDSSEAFKLYTGLRERIRSRFLNSSLIYCALISSSKSKSGMVWEYIHKIKPDDPETLLLDPAIWEVKGDALGLSGKHFWIYIGTKTHPSKVLPEEYNDVPLEKLNYVPPAGCELLEVPIEYRREFENNIEAAIQNIAGRTTDTSDRPFDDLSRIGDCKQLLPEVHLEAPLGDQIPLIDKLPKELFQETTLGPRLARYPNAPRFVHVDLASQSTSQAGYSLWHKEYVVNDLGEHQTVFVADFVSWISAPNRIDHDAIKQLSLDLRDKAGVYIKTISYDQFQCFTGDTKVSLLNGEEVSFKDILERFNSGEELFTYTLDLKTKKVVPGRIINAKNNGKKRIMKVVLDNDEEIRCTLDHRFMLSNGDFIQAQYLNCDDSLMPLYSKSIKVKYIEFLDEYEDVYDISIDKAPNFALSAGVFVHNSEYVRQSLQQHHEFENVRYQSVDRDITAYLNFAQWMITGRIKVGDCPYLREQLGYIGVADKKLVTTHKKDMADSCLAYDTKIFLLSGKVLTIEELYNSDIEHEWVLACDCESKQLKPVKIERVLEKHIPETLLQFTLSNGKTFACTDDHLILMKSGEYKQAEDIAPYDELMPFNYYHELNYHDRYRKVVNPFKGTSKFLYKIVSQDLLSNAIAEAKKRAVIDGSKFTVIHHKSHNKNDDRPENLVPLTNIEHTNLHAMTGREIKAFHDRTVMKRARTKIINEGLALMKQVNPEGYRRYLLKHDLGDKLAEQKSKVENLHVYVTQITKIENTKPVYDIVLNSIHNFALDCNVFVHNCVGAVNNAYLDATPVEFPYIEAKTQEVKAEDSFVYDSKKQEVIEI